MLLVTVSTLSPSAVVHLAKHHGLSAIALTDHDTIKGTAPFLDASRARGFRGIAGVEISADFSPGTMHILGYFVKPDDVLEQALLRIRDGRVEDDSSSPENP